MNVKVLVTGAKGFIGSHLVNHLKQQGYWVRAVDITDKCFLITKEDEFWSLNLKNPLQAITACHDIDWVFNLAANMGGIGYITGTVDAEIMRDNALININVLEACRLQDVSRIFFSSSACTYPKYLQEISEVKGLKESDVLPAEPDSMYGWEKLFSEFLYQSYYIQFGLETRIARFHNIYGTHCTWQGGQEKAPAALCRKVAEACNGGSVTVWGDGKQTRSFTYITDCLEAVCKLMNSDFRYPINIGTDELVTIDELTQLIIGIAKKDLKIVHDTAKPQGVRGRNADLTLLKKKLNWQPKITLIEGISHLYSWIESLIS